MQRLQPGFLLGDRYTLGERIAAGGMGQVWTAEDERLGRVVAVKIMHPHTADEEVFARRFTDEARLAAQLMHPGIVTIHDFGEEDGLAYLVMEYVEGNTVASLLRERGPLDPELVRSLIGQVASALQAAHEAGIVHRDIKPGNILVDADGTAKLMDFGIARAVDGVGMTREGEVLGTPNYLSPEQALGQVATPSSDLYALGVVAHEMLTGRKPFETDTPVGTALAQVAAPPPPLPPGVPADLAVAIMSCLEKAPEDRPADAEALLALLYPAAAAPGYSPVAPGMPTPLGPEPSSPGAEPAHGAVAVDLESTQASDVLEIPEEVLAASGVEPAAVVAPGAAVAPSPAAAVAPVPGRGGVAAHWPAIVALLVFAVFLLLIFVRP